MSKFELKIIRYKISILYKCAYIMSMFRLKKNQLTLRKYATDEIQVLISVLYYKISMIIMSLPEIFLPLDLKILPHFSHV